MSRCFVIQPFDGGLFDKRYDDVLEPAIRAAMLEPYRVDRDPHASIPIESIEKGIRDSDLCLAEITSNNPNVWFELGFAIACGKEVVLVCAENRDGRFPFDIQHRHVIRYKSESASDFAKLGESVTERLAAAMKKERQIAHLAESPIADTEGLEYHEISALVTITESSLDPDAAPSGWSLKQDLAKAGFTGLAAVLAVKRLLKLGMVESVRVSDRNEEYLGYRATSEGENWLMRNQAQLLLRRKATPQDDDELPF